MKVFTTFICLILQWEHCFLLHESYPTLTITVMCLHYSCTGSQEGTEKAPGVVPYDSVPWVAESTYSSEDTKNKNHYLDENGIKSLRF